MLQFMRTRTVCCSEAYALQRNRRKCWGLWDVQEIMDVRGGTAAASQEEVEKLLAVVVSKAGLAGMGEGMQCPVCREALVEGETVSEMPCTHPYHPECLKPWLEEHNSCPMCRLELRTYMEDYQHKKQSKQEAEKQRRRVQLARKQESMATVHLGSPNILCIGACAPCKSGCHAESALQSSMSEGVELDWRLICGGVAEGREDRGCVVGDFREKVQKLVEKEVD
ncbi:uncharacterized protein [Physcomitrium patens]|uniref:uncharacterized protein isoform X1 n=1 Tax=Physcomitrium patens TaxID=3218 RepID=UPI000D167D5B|nr:E3 ubiquitin-protein ligase AIP2-like isoform X1 [Physcomitrium patens]|eukprot:XP_024388311.1 E3 ubiquitin-protein ligase AIP2-like isoform X1 [Physcomitrella patens]